MILPRFDFVDPVSVTEICSVLQQEKGEAAVIAGGTDLLVNMKRKKITKATVVSLNKVPSLKEISYSAGDGLKIGSMVTMSELAESKIVRDNFPALAEAAVKLGSSQVRNRATIGGNICSGRPAADTVGPLLAYEATVKLVGAGGERLIPLGDFFTGPGKTVAEYDEIMTEILVNDSLPNTHAGYIKFGIRKAMEIAVVSVVSVITLEPGQGHCRQARIVLGAVAPTFIRCPLAEKLLEGAVITAEIAAQAGSIAAQTCRPISDTRGSAEYRRMLVKALTQRTILEAGDKTAPLTER